MSRNEIYLISLHGTGMCHVESFFSSSLFGDKKSSLPGERLEEGSNNVFKHLIENLFVEKLRTSNSIKSLCRKSKKIQVQSASFSPCSVHLRCSHHNVCKSSFVFFRILFCTFSGHPPLFSLSPNLNPVKVVFEIWKIYELERVKSSNGRDDSFVSGPLTVLRSCCVLHQIFIIKKHNSDQLRYESNEGRASTHRSHICGFVYFCMLSAASRGQIKILLHRSPAGDFGRKNPTARNDNVYVLSLKIEKI